MSYHVGKSWHTQNIHIKRWKSFAPAWSEVKKWSEVAQSCPTLCDPMDSSLPGSTVHGIFQARVLEWAAISFSRGSSQTRDRACVFCIADRHFTIWATREALHQLGYVNYCDVWVPHICVHVCPVVQSCPTLWDLMDCILPGSSVLGIFQARILEWVAISFSRGSSWPRDWTHVLTIFSHVIPYWNVMKMFCF